MSAPAQAPKGEWFDDVDVSKWKFLCGGYHLLYEHSNPQLIYTILHMLTDDFDAYSRLHMPENFSFLGCFNF